MCDMFLILKTVYYTGYADDNTPFTVADDIKDLIWSLKETDGILSLGFLTIK